MGQIFLTAAFGPSGAGKTEEGRSDACGLFIFLFSGAGGQTQGLCILPLRASILPLGYTPLPMFVGLLQRFLEQLKGSGSHDRGQVAPETGGGGFAGARHLRGPNLFNQHFQDTMRSPAERRTRGQRRKASQAHPDPAGPAFTMTVGSCLPCTSGELKPVVTHTF